MLNLEKLCSSTQKLYNDIDDCTSKLVKARLDKDSESEGKALFQMEGLMVASQQQFAYILENLSIKSSEDNLKEVNGLLDYMIEDYTYLVEQGTPELNSYQMNKQALSLLKSLKDCFK